MKQGDFFDLTGMAEDEPMKKERAAESSADGMSSEQPENLNLREIEQPAPDGAGKAGDSDHLNFEEAISRLEKLVNELQKSDLSLDRSMLLFREGTELVAACREHLDQAEQQVKILLEKASGTSEADFPDIQDEG